MPRCSAPKSVSIASYFRAKPRKKATRKPDARSTYVVLDSSGDVVSRHRSLSAARTAANRYDRADRRRGKRTTHTTKRI